MGRLEELRQRFKSNASQNNLCGSLDDGLQRSIQGVFGFGEARDRPILQDGYGRLQLKGVYGGRNYDAGTQKLGTHSDLLAFIDRRRK